MTLDSVATTTAFVGLGSNLNSPRAQIENAFELLGAIAGTQLIDRSSLYRSSPYGSVVQADFVNAVAHLSTDLDAPSLLRRMQDIEISQGRVRGVHWGPRTLDLDLLVFGDQEIDEQDLTVPHPGIAERNFVLLPLREIAPELDIPGLGCVSDIPVDESEPQISRIE